MNVLLFFANNWQDILVGLALIAACITGIRQWVKKNGSIFKTMTTAEKIAYVTRLLKNLVPIALVLVTDAEIQFGGGTGKLKRSYVIDELYKRIPDEYKKLVTEENLDAIINKVLEEAEKLWSDNPSVKQIMEASVTATTQTVYPTINEEYIDEVAARLATMQRKGQTKNVR